jgi:hypothetical protein
VRVGHLVQADDERAVSYGEVVRVGVPVGLDEGDDALMVVRPGGLVQPPLGDDLEPEAWNLTEPRLGSEGALGDEQLQHLALRRPQHFPHGPAAVDEVARHAFGTSRKPPGAS